MVRKFSLAKGMFSTKLSLAKGIRSKTAVAQPRQKFFRVHHPTPGSKPSLDCAGKSKIKKSQRWKVYLAESFFLFG